MSATGAPPNPANIFDPANQAWLSAATPAQVSAYSKQDDLTFARTDAQNDLKNIEHDGGVFSDTLNGEIGTFGVLESTTDYLNGILKESGVDPSGYYDSSGFVGASPNSNAPTSTHIVASRSLTPGGPTDTNPASQLPISGRPVLTVPVKDGSGNGTAGGSGGPAGGSGGPPVGSGNGSGTTKTGSGSSGSSDSGSTADQNILSQLIALAAAQNSGGGGSGAGGLVALPTGIADSSTVAAPTSAASHTGAVLLILLISGLAFWYYKKHKKAA